MPLAFFDGGKGRPAGVLKVPPDVSTEFKQRLREALRGRATDQSLLLLDADAEFLEMRTPLDQSQFVEQRRLVAQEVARCFRVPPHLIGAPSADSMTYSNVEQESIEFVRYSLTPWLRRIEEAISNDGDLCFQRQYVRFELDGLLRADTKTRAEVYAIAIANGWLDAEEVRRLEDLPPRGGGTPPPSTNGNNATQIGVSNGRA
jgi:HK97 family phage portal protein